jgi:recombinational DNA repair protein (RecF pathway)
VILLVLSWREQEDTTRPTTPRLSSCAEARDVDIIKRSIYIHRVPPKKLYNFLIDSDLAKGLKRLKAETGVAESEILRRALREYLRKNKAITARRRRAAAGERRRED